MDEIGVNQYVWTLAEYDPIKYREIINECSYSEICMAFTVKIAANSIVYPRK